MDQQIKSSLFRAGYLTIKIPEKELETGIYRYSFYVPRSELLDPNVKGKIGSFQVQVKPKGFLGRNRVLCALSSKYTTIDVFVKE